jgi:hypothetical protein
MAAGQILVFAGQIDPAGFSVPVAQVLVEEISRWTERRYSIGSQVLGFELRIILDRSRKSWPLQ